MANYGRRYRGGQRISTAFVESAFSGFTLIHVVPGMLQKG